MSKKVKSRSQIVSQSIRKLQKERKKVSQIEITKEVQRELDISYEAVDAIARQYVETLAKYLSNGYMVNTHFGRFVAVWEKQGDMVREIWLFGKYKGTWTNVRSQRGKSRA